MTAKPQQRHSQAVNYCNKILKMIESVVKKALSINHIVHGHCTVNCSFRNLDFINNQVTLGKTL